MLRRIAQELRDRVHRRRSADRLPPNPWQEAQNAFMIHCLADYDVTLKGVIHVGGHLGEEYSIYKRAGARRIAFFEPLPDLFDALRRRFENTEDVVLINRALGARNEVREMNIGRGGRESTSFLRPTTLYDGCFEEQRLPLEIVTLDSWVRTDPHGNEYNMLVTDTQGFDLEVLKGSQETLHQIEYIYTEVSNGHYEGEPTVEQFDAFLAPFGFIRKDMSLYGSWKGQDAWGDLFYARRR
jgi:FkbM family methyltransferase